MLNVLNGTTEIASRHVALDNDAALDTFAHDEVGAAVLLDRRHACKRNARAGGRIEEHFTNAAERVFLTRAALITILGDQREADLPFENPPDLASDQHCLDPAGHLAGRQAKT